MNDISIDPTPRTLDFDAPEFLGNQRSSLDRDGFTRVGSVSSAAEVANIRLTLSDVLTKKKGHREGALFDTLSVSNDGQGNRSIQMTSPSNYAPELLDTTYVANATRLARHLLDPDCIPIADYALVKPAYTGRGTPWHQDEALIETPTSLTAN